MFYYDDTGYIPARPIFYLETVLPPTKRMQPLSTEVHAKSPSRTRDYRDDVKWENAENDSKQNPILFRRRP